LDAALDWQHGPTLYMKRFLRGVIRDAKEINGQKLVDGRGEPACLDEPTGPNDVPR